MANQEIKEASREYFARKHQELKNDYKREGSNDSFRCVDIARELEKLLIAEGKKPRVFGVIGERCDGLGHRKMLVPKLYRGRIAWMAHLVAVADNFVFDPMLDKPIPFEDYCALAFEGRTELKLWPY